VKAFWQPLVCTNAHGLQRPSACSADPMLGNNSEPGAGAVGGGGGGGGAAMGKRGEALGTGYAGATPADGCSGRSAQLTRALAKLNTARGLKSAAREATVRLAGGSNNGGDL